jgi:hypothetical protein
MITAVEEGCSRDAGNPSSLPLIADPDGSLSRDGALYGRGRRSRRPGRVDPVAEGAVPDCRDSSAAFSRFSANPLSSGEAFAGPERYNKPR